ncbi:hypothetical protein P4O66_007693 [Electrophorus voltai]|uniref:Uncharacterized protein n=1 Tax=Electrophorus voltai TaxID=2609070 RepID=A0AAD8ZHX2_9TELE|nr:hypothetical protein P4O66_007693 [Electrophorus voltai]
METVHLQPSNGLLLSVATTTSFSSLEAPRCQASGLELYPPRACAYPDPYHPHRCSGSEVPGLLWHFPSGLAVLDDPSRPATAHRASRTSTFIRTVCALSEQALPCPRRRWPQANLLRPRSSQEARPIRRRRVSQPIVICDYVANLTHPPVVAAPPGRQDSSREWLPQPVGTTEPQIVLLQKRSTVNGTQSFT